MGSIIVCWDALTAIITYLGIIIYRRYRIGIGNIPTSLDK